MVPGTEPFLEIFDDQFAVRTYGTNLEHREYRGLANVKLGERATKNPSDAETY